jgi:cysteine synthase
VKNRARGQAVNVRSDFLEAIGNTPLIRLRPASDITGCDIYGKAEFLNPGGSIKDRAALAIINDAEQRGQLKPGGVIVEGTAGNVGGIALVAHARGYRYVIVMPDTQSQKKKDMLRLCGADLRLMPAVPYSNPSHYARYSRRLAEELAAKEPNGASGQISSTTSPTAMGTVSRLALKSGSRLTERSTASPAPSAVAVLRVELRAPSRNAIPM